MNKSAAISITAITALLLIAVAVLSVFLSVSLQEQGQYRRMANNEYEQAYYRLGESMGNVRVNLDKARVVQDSAMMCELMMDASVSCESAAQALYKFSADGYSASALTKFANQVGEYCAYLHSKAAKGEEITQSDYSTLQKLSQTAALVQEKLAPVREGMGEGGYAVHPLGEGIALAVGEHKRGELYQFLVPIAEANSGGVFHHGIRHPLEEGGVSNGVAPKAVSIAVHEVTLYRLREHIRPRHVALPDTRKHDARHYQDEYHVHALSHSLSTHGTRAR